MRGQPNLGFLAACRCNNTICICGNDKSLHMGTWLTPIPGWKIGLVSEFARKVDQGILPRLPEAAALPSCADHGAPVSGLGGPCSASGSRNVPSRYVPDGSTTLCRGYGR